MMTDLIPLESLPTEVPSWPYAPWSTGRLIRLKQLGHVRVGRRVFVTRELLNEFIARHTVKADSGAKP